MGISPHIPPWLDYPFISGWAGTRFTDNLDGTITDNLSGLVWLKDASCSGLAGTDTSGRGSWQTALDAVKTLAEGTCGLSDGSTAGQWRLPNINELFSLGPFGNYWQQSGPFVGLPSAPVYSPSPYTYWSTSTQQSTPDRAWYAHVYNDTRSHFDKDDNTFYILPVRGGK
jgi:hypothetical protein